MFLPQPFVLKRKLCFVLAAVAMCHWHGWTPEEWKAWIVQLPSEDGQGWTKAQWEEWWLKRMMRCCNLHMERAKL